MANNQSATILLLLLLLPTYLKGGGAAAEMGWDAAVVRETKPLDESSGSGCQWGELIAPRHLQVRVTFILHHFLKEPRGLVFSPAWFIRFITYFASRAPVFILILMSSWQCGGNIV